MRSYPRIAHTRESLIRANRSYARIILLCRQREGVLVIRLEKAAACPTCQHCGAEIKLDVDNECPGCHRDVKECVIDKDVTSSVYPM
ncbi:hypothetical protein MCP_2886 [Methanocella paludicola SANAE]|uniref:Uncharacterized protein n=1 Tax=Methanocella paludicola (strain DSM 17711 / JCM 13418 / NBRC 101707 / SANAE) TaxID=304371 RepID=D1Z2N6_METPS|nr:hypothetical protein MCP_2886 [Methanocella paludicola SANAE]